MRGRSPVTGFAIACLAGGLVAVCAHAQGNVVLPRPGQVGLGVQGQYGTLLKSGEVGSLFDSGPGLAVRLRYRMRYERAIGLSFESQEFDARRTFSDSLFAPKTATAVLTGFEVYQMFGTRTRTTKMVSVGLGLAQITYELVDGEKTFPGDGMYLSAGAGIERFLYRNWALDLSTRYQAVFHRSKVNHDLHAAVGVIFYASY